MYGLAIAFSETAIRMDIEPAVLGVRQQGGMSLLGVLDHAVAESTASRHRRASSLCSTGVGRRLLIHVGLISAPKAADRRARLSPRKGLIMEKISRSIIGEFVRDVGVLGARVSADDADAFVGVSWHMGKVVSVSLKRTL